MTDGEKLAWAAGFFDGEGCVAVANGNSLYMSAAQIDRTPLDQLTEILGGKVYGPRYPSREGRRPIFEWKLTTHHNVVRALRCLLPFLTCKHAQATLAMTFPICAKGERITGEMHIERIVIDAQLRALKKL